MKRSEFKRFVRSMVAENVPGKYKVQWVWTWVGKYPTGVPGASGYFVMTKGGKTSFWFAEWTEGYPVRVKRQTVQSWQLLSQQDQSVIKGGSGNVPAPATFGVSV